MLQVSRVPRGKEADKLGDKPAETWPNYKEMLGTIRVDEEHLWVFSCQLSVFVFQPRRARVSL